MFALERLDAEAVYLRLPIPLQNVGCSFVGWRTERTRYAGAFPKVFEEAVARTHWSIEEVTGLRDIRLASIIERAAGRSPFYRERFREAGIAPSGVKSMKDLSSLPILTKHEAQQHMLRIASTAFPSRETRMVHTSGTTGGALRFPVTMNAIQEQWAIWWRYRSWHGIKKGTWSALFAGRSVVPSKQDRPPFWRVNRPGRQLLFSGYHMSPENLSAYVGELRRRKPPWLHGYPSLLALLAAYLEEWDCDLGYEIRWVTTGAENLLPHQSAVIERALGVKPIQHYGLAEGVANMSQCELGRMHVDEDFAAVEFVPLGQDGLHRIIGTNLTNPAAPLLRYDTQDLATIREGSACTCGRPGRLVEKVDGRLEDYVVLRNGVRIGRMDHIFKDMINVQEAQIHQARPGEMTIRVVRGRGYGDEDEQELLREAEKRVGDDMEIGVEYLNSLPRSPTGKLRFVLSELPGASIEGLPRAPR
jgi:phenylacetate-coenzyme A ligase PaaK-like adenylate-forming protein